MCFLRSKQLDLKISRMFWSERKMFKKSSLFSVFQLEKEKGITLEKESRKNTIECLIKRNILLYNNISLYEIFLMCYNRTCNLEKMSIKLKNVSI